MFKRKITRHVFGSSGKYWPAALLGGLSLLTSAGCNSFFHSNKQYTVTSESGEKIPLNDATVKQYVSEWHDAKPQIDRLGKLETDLNFLLSEVSKMSDLGQMPGLGGGNSAGATQAPIAGNITLTTSGAANSPTGNKPVAGTQPTSYFSNAPAAAEGQAMANTGAVGGAIGGNIGIGAGGISGAANANGMSNSGGMSVTSMGIGAMSFNPSNALCAEPYVNNYTKALAIANFPRIQVNSSKFGQLAQVEQHLPLLIGANLHNRHSLLVPAYIPAAFSNAYSRGEPAAAAQAIRVASQNRVQFMVTGEVDDMSMYSPDDANSPGYFRKFMNGTIDMFGIDTKYDNRSRVFSFSLQVRDGITGQLIFNNQYKTVGQWNAPSTAEMGFASPRFWQTDYGHKVQQLVASASDDLASSIRCQPYIARVDARPFQPQIIIQSGNNNGLRTGDSFELYQLVYQPVTGEYQQFDTRLIKRNGRVYLTEIYPSHSVGQVVNDTLSGGQYIVKAQ